MNSFASGFLAYVAGVYTGVLLLIIGIVAVLMVAA